MNQHTLLNNVMFQTLLSCMQTENEKEKKKQFTLSSFLRDNAGDTISIEWQVRRSPIRCFVRWLANFNL